ncbi:hypothetical protein BK671_15250 [Pseudomonas fluorescens]|uniref:BrnA antitoxin of type II toxin-antitoxin system n=1 Tax=Pseudomonas fluorescens TaxID=294 RepID=A0A423LGK5_PSEFL|nr:hypothetical protein BK671_15250 [Pseudomonas fluorescens]
MPARLKYSRRPTAWSHGKTRVTIMLDDTVIEAARTVAENDGFSYQTVINNTLDHVLLDATAKPEQVESTGQFTATDLKRLEKKLSAAVGEIRRILEPDAKP